MVEESVRTPSAQAMINVTGVIQQMIKKSGVRDAHILVSVPHTTAALTVNENADPDVVHDLLLRLEKMIPTTEPGDLHGEGNSHAHLKSSLFGSCHPFIVADGSLVLGIWQGIFLCEFDGPRTRRLMVSILKS